MTTVYGTTLPDEGRKFQSGPVAQQWLRAQDPKYVPRDGQPGEWVAYGVDGTIFASVVEDDGESWTPNYGRAYDEMKRGGAPCAHQNGHSKSK